MKFLVMILEEVGQKYCNPGEHIVHEYYIQTLAINGRVGAYRRSLYTEEYTHSSDDFKADTYDTYEEAECIADSLKKSFPRLNLKVVAMTDDEFIEHSTASLKRV